MSVFCQVNSKLSLLRVFDVRVQGKPSLSSFDVIKESGGRNRAIVKEFSRVLVGDELVMEFTPTSAKLRAAILSGIEIQAEGW